MGICDSVRSFFGNKSVLPDTKESEAIPPVTQMSAIAAPAPVKVVPTNQPMPTQLAYSHLDPTHLIPRLPLQMALDYFDAHPDQFPNKRYVSIVDYSQHCSKLRFYTVDMTTGAVERHAVAHGKNSDPENDGYATSFSNINGSEQSSLGFIQTGEIYSGTHPHEMRLNGLSTSNSNIRARSVVCHPCDYVIDGAAHNGRSWGCLAVMNSIEVGLTEKLKNGSLIFCYHPSFKDA